MDFLAIGTEALIGGLKNILQIALIVIPLLVLIQVFQDLNLLDKWTRIFTPLTRLIKVSPAGNLPIFSGMFFGIIYGGGIIIREAQEGKLSPSEIYMVNLFLVLCHGMIEEPLLFAAIGAKWIPLVVMRFFFALVICWVVSRMLPVGEETIKEESF